MTGIALDLVAAGDGVRDDRGSQWRNETMTMSDSEIMANHPRRADESEDQWIGRLRREKAKQFVQAAIDDRKLVRLPDDGIIERERLN
jgi:hypothetical protein